MADLFDPFGLVFDHIDDDNRMNLDVVPLADGAVQVRIFAPNKATTNRSVILGAGATQRLQLALAGHLRADELRGLVDVLREQLEDAHAQIMRLGGEVPTGPATYAPAGETVA